MLLNDGVAATILGDHTFDRVDLVARLDHESERVGSNLLVVGRARTRTAADAHGFSGPDPAGGACSGCPAMSTSSLGFVSHPPCGSGNPAAKAAPVPHPARPRPRDAGLRGDAGEDLGRPQVDAGAEEGDAEARVQRACSGLRQRGVDVLHADVAALADDLGPREVEVEDRDPGGGFPFTSAVRVALPSLIRSSSGAATCRCSC